MQPGIITGICRGNIRTIEIYKRFWGSTEAVVNKVQGAQTIGTSQTSMKTPSREHILNCKQCQSYVSWHFPYQKNCNVYKKSFIFAVFYVEISSSLIKHKICPLQRYVEALTAARLICTCVCSCLYSCSSAVDSQYIACCRCLSPSVKPFSVACLKLAS